MVFCTLFDSNYLDKGLVMYRSLVKTGCDFKMYVLAMDDKCKEVLDAYNYNNLITISLDNFSNDVGLSEVRKTRPRGEFCWTCTSFLIDYVLTEFDEPICTYVDSDLYFYSNPKCLIDEMGDKTVQIVEHRFSEKNRFIAKKAGTYCVQFNTFKNTLDSLKLLHWWKIKSLESCRTDDGGNGVYGDQGYLEEWGKKANVSVLQHLGGGVAPWNVAQYKLVSEDTTSTSPVLMEKKTKKIFNLIFYHYQHITYLDVKKVNIHVYNYGKAEDNLIKYLYIPYLKSIDLVKNELRERFDIYPFLMSHPGFKNNFQVKMSIGEVIKKIKSIGFHKLYGRIISKSKQRRETWKNTVSF